MTFRVLDLFSGIGGFSLGLERTGGFETVAFCEIEEFPRRVLAKHWPGVPIYDDVRTLTAARLAADGIVPDVICGGFPCQDISLAGKGAGIDGTRSSLWSEYARIIGELRPCYVIVENVAALLNRGLDRVLGDLAALGFDAEWHCIPASAVGAPHRRDRIWIVAHPRCQHSEWWGGECGGPQATGACDRSARPSEHAEHVADASGVCGQNQPGSHHSERQSVGTIVRASGGINGRCASERDNELGRSGGIMAQAVADACGTGLSQPEPQALFGAGRRDEGRATAECGWWELEPDVGGSLDGFPAWLDRYVGRGLSYAESRRRTEVLRDLWSDHLSQALRRAAGGLERLHQAEVLFAFVREYESGAHEARILMAGSEAPEGFLRSLRERGIARSAPRRPGYIEQRSAEHPDALQPVPRLLACNGEAHWAGGGWEDATPRVATGVPARVDRLRALGNAVVPQVIEVIGRAILAQGNAP